MEIYNFYEAIKASMMLTDNMGIVLVSGGISAAIWIMLFILQGLGLYAMATKQGLKNRALAFVPFINIWYIGKLAGECNFFGQRMKRAGMYAMIAQILVVVMSILTVAAEQYLWFTQGAPQMQTEYGYYWTGLYGFASHVAKFWDISSYVLPIFHLFVEIFLVVIMMGLCKKYEPKNYRVLGFLVLFIPMSRFIIIFVLRKRQPIDFDAYMRARHEAYMRSQQQYYNRQTPYGNPYGNSYGNPYGNAYGRPNAPYGQQYGGEQPGESPEEPFGEFASENKGGNGNEPLNETRGGSDDFFS